MLLQSIISQGSFLNEDLQDVSQFITGGIETNINEFLWFRPYLSTDFPEVICNKKYFYLYATDHDSNLGGIYWGEGDNINGTDFDELGLIIEGFQAETPFLVRDDSVQDNEVIHLFYHTGGSEQGNNGKQQTRLLTTSGGELHIANWTDRGRPLGLEAGENHTGYLKLYKNPTETNYIGIHLTKGGLPPEYKFSKTTTNVRNIEREGVYDIYNGIQENYRVKPSYGMYFERYGIRWFLGTIEPLVGDENSEPDKQLILAKTNEDLQITEQVVVLNYGDKTRNYEIFIEDNYAHVYFNRIRTNVWYGRYNLENLLNYLD
jgi:hypothetical protein